MRRREITQVRRVIWELLDMIDRLNHESLRPLRLRAQAAYDLLSREFVADRLTKREEGYRAALRDVEAFARHWRWLEAGERGTGEAGAVEYILDQIRHGVYAPQHDDEQMRLGEAAAERSRRERQELAQ